MDKYSLPSSLKSTFKAAAFVVFSFSFMRGCDPVTGISFNIENQASSNIEVQIYGLGQSWIGKKDSLRILEQGEMFRVFSQEQMGTSPRSSKREIVYFADSIRIKNLDKNSVTVRDLMDLNEWEFHKDQHRLIIHEEDFE